MAVRLSIIIPVFNEVVLLGKTLQHIKQCLQDADDVEIIIADGGSTDGSLKIVHDHSVKLVCCKNKGRTQQMNEGAEQSQGEILFFLHADTLPPVGFRQFIYDALQESVGAGCFQLSFDQKNSFLSLNAWFTRFDVNAFRFGDQGLFIARNIFTLVKGFDEKHIVFEDQDIVRRIRKFCKFKILPFKVITSARMYTKHGVYKTQLVYFTLYFLYRFGVRQSFLLRLYKRILY